MKYPTLQGVDLMEIYHEPKFISVWMTNEEEKRYDRKQLTAQLLKNADDPKCQVIFYLSVKGNLFENTNRLLLANL